MKSPSIVGMGPAERKNLVTEIERGILQENSKKILVDTLSFIDSLIEELKTSKINIHKLKQLLGFRSELLKKVTQSR